MENYYPGKDLGVTYNKSKTKVRIWTPVADRVSILLFQKETDIKPFKIKRLKKDIKGTWYTEINGDMEGVYYLFRIFNKGEYNDTVDPYAKAVGTDSKKGLIVDLKKTNPRGWDRDQRIKLKNPVDAIIYELHVKDFSISPESGMKNKGKYLAFTEEATVNSDGYTTGLEHLKELGITHVHLLPVFDFATVSDNSISEYNWGYDPYYYNVPEGSYATEPSNASRIKEFKQLVHSLHKNNIGVIMDVVYNHTYYTMESAFQLTVPDYFYRFIDGKCANGSGCGNELAT